MVSEIKVVAVAPQAAAERAGEGATPAEEYDQQGDPPGLAVQSRGLGVKAVAELQKDPAALGILGEAAVEDPVHGGASYSELQGATSLVLGTVILSPLKQRIAPHESSTLLPSLLFLVLHASCPYCQMTKAWPDIAMLHHCMVQRQEAATILQPVKRGPVVVFEIVLFWGCTLAPLFFIIYYHVKIFMPGQEDDHPASQKWMNSYWDHMGHVTRTKLVNSMARYNFTCSM